MKLNKTQLEALRDKIYDECLKPITDYNNTITNDSVFAKIIEEVKHYEDIIKKIVSGEIISFNFRGVNHDIIVVSSNYLTCNSSIYYYCKTLLTKKTTFTKEKIYQELVLATIDSADINELIEKVKNKFLE